jgi:hypothetical protein
VELEALHRPHHKIATIHDDAILDGFGFYQ